MPSPGAVVPTAGGLEHLHPQKDTAPSPTSEVNVCTGLGAGMRDEYFGLSAPSAFCQMRHSLIGECWFPFVFSNDRVLFTTRLFSAVRLDFKLSLLKTELRIRLTTSISEVVFSSLSFVLGLFQDRNREK